jgi:hypothetical protein
MMLEALSYIASIPTKLPLETVLGELVACFSRVMINLHPE